MADELVAGTGRSGPDIVELDSVPGFLVFDLPGVALSAGGTRLAPDVSAAEVALLARAMTYKYAALGWQVGGAKAGVRGNPADRAGKAALMARFCAEIAPLINAGRFVTGPDMGTSEEDFAPLREGRAVPSAMGAVLGGVPFEDVLTGYGVAAAAEAALGAEWGWGWDGRSAAIEGFGKVGGGVAREVIRRGGRVVAVSTVAGCVEDPDGLDVELLLALRREHGDECVTRYGRPAGPPARLFAVTADVVVPGTRPGVISGQVAGLLPPGVQVVAPAANAPYTAAGAAVLRQRGIVALPDFVCNAGAVIGYRAARDATPGQILAAVDARVSELIAGAMRHPDGPLAGACQQAAEFLRGWWGEPPGPPFAPGLLSGGHLGPLPVGHPRLLPHPAGLGRAAVRDPQGHVQDADQRGPGGAGRAERLDLGPGGGILEQAAQHVAGPAGHVDRLDDHVVADRAQPGALAGQQLGRAGRADAVDRRQRVPQHVDVPQVVVGGVPQVGGLGDRGQHLRPPVPAGVQQDADDLGAPGDVQQRYGQQVVGGDLIRRIAAQIAEGHPGELRLTEVSGHGPVQARCGQAVAQAAGRGADRVVSR